ncbi:MAG: PIN domain-containing protein [Syntrophobacteraceae bacterium]
MLNIIIDANQVREEGYFLDSNVFLLLVRYFAKHPDSKFFVPQVVIEETVRNFSLEFKGPFFRKLIHYITDGKYNGVSEIMSWYRSYLENKLSELGATFLNYPEVDHKSIIERYVTGTRPFKDKKADSGGY